MVPLTNFKGYSNYRNQVHHYALFSSLLFFLPLLLFFLIRIFLPFRHGANSPRAFIELYECVCRVWSSFFFVYGFWPISMRIVHFRTWHAYEMNDNLIRCSMSISCKFFRRDGWICAQRLLRLHTHTHTYWHDQIKCIQYSFFVSFNVIATVATQRFHSKVAMTEWKPTHTYSSDIGPKNFIYVKCGMCSGDGRYYSSLSP